MSTDQAMVEIRRWFDRAENAGMVLPSGWFGRPYDNRHELTFLGFDSGWLVMELDGQLTLTFRGEVTVTPQAGELLVGGFDELVFAWREYGDSHRRHSSTFQGGSVSFKALLEIPEYKSRTASM